MNSGEIVELIDLPVGVNAVDCEGMVPGLVWWF
jgi:hypothetical protein